MHRGIHSQRFIEKRRRRRQTLLFLFVLCLLTLSASSIFILRAPFLQIQTVSVEGSQLAPEDAVVATTLASLSGSYARIIPHSNSFFFPRRSLEQVLEDNFKQIDSFTIKRRGLTGLHVSLVERRPAAIVCSGFREVGEEGECYWSDDKGYVFGALASSSPQAKTFTHYYLPIEQGSITAGASFIPEKRFTELQKFMAGALKGGLTPLGVLLGEKGQYEMYVKNKRGDSEATVYFDDRSSFTSTLENLLTFWNNPSSGTHATSTSAFNYINLRFGNTVYYSTQ